MIREHRYEELERDEADTHGIPRPGDRVGYFFGVKASGIVIASDPQRKIATVLWTLHPRQPPFIDDNGMFYTKVSVPTFQPLEWVEIKFEVTDDR